MIKNATIAPIIDPIIMNSVKNESFIDVIMVDE